MTSPQGPAAGQAAGPVPSEDERYRAERKRVVRIFEKYSSEQRASRAASHRLGPRQRSAVGEFFYTHPDLPRTAFRTRGDAAWAAVRATSPKELPDG